jgi:hypothetical protein
MSAVSRGLFGLTQDVEEIVWDGFVDHLIEHLAQFHADGLLTQARFVERRSALSPLIHVSLFNHAKGRGFKAPTPVNKVPFTRCNARPSIRVPKAKLVYLASERNEAEL